MKLQKVDFFLAGAMVAQAFNIAVSFWIHVLRPRFFPGATLKAENQCRRADGGESD